MLGVDERGDPAVPLGIGHRVQRDGRLAAGFRPEELDDPPARQPLPPQRQVQRQGPRRDPLDFEVGPLPQLHDRAGAERFLDLADRVVQRLGVGRHRRRLDLGRSLSLGHDNRSFMGICFCTQEHYRSIIFRFGQGFATVFFPESGALASWA